MVVQSLLKDPSAACVAAERTPLHAACLNGRVEVARLLLEARASPNCAGGELQPLHLAAQGCPEAWFS